MTSRATDIPGVYARDGKNMPLQAPEPIDIGPRPLPIRTRDGHYPVVPKANICARVVLFPVQQEMGSISSLALGLHRFMILYLLLGYVYPTSDETNGYYAYTGWTI